MKAASSSRRQPRVLLVTSHTPLPWEDGAGAYLHDIARFLGRNGFVVDVLWLRPHDHLRWGKVWQLPEAFDRNLRLHLPGSRRVGRHYFFPDVIWLPLKANLLHRAKQCLALAGIGVKRRRRPHSPAVASQGQPARWIAAPSPGELAIVNAFAEHLKPDVVIANYAWMCPLLALPSLATAQHVCLTHDIVWKRSALSNDDRTSNTLPSVTPEMEAAWLAAADMLIAISDLDATELAALHSNKTIMVVPKALGNTSPGHQSNSLTLLFVGSENAFNAEGLTWFLTEVWPLIQGAVPGANVEVCGSISRSVTLRPAGVTFRGIVPDLAPFYASAAVAIIPLFRSTGLNIKLVEAAAYRRPFVMTSVTLHGAPFLKNAAIVADTPADFAQAVVGLLGDRKARAAAATRVLEAVGKKLAPEVCYGPLAVALRSSL